MSGENIPSKNYTTNSRLDWVDQVKGFTIFLVVYGHNFPFTEKYIYSFHMPLFIIVSGFFHPSHVTFDSLKKRFQTIMVPYFIWSLALFTFWVLIARNYGENVLFHLSPVKNFIGGGNEFQ